MMTETESITSRCGLASLLLFASLLIWVPCAFAGDTSAGLDTNAYARMCRLDDQVDIDGLRALASELDRSGGQINRQLALLSRAIADYRNSRFPSCAARLDSLHRLSPELEPTIHAVMRKFRAGIRRYMGDRPAGMNEIMAGLEVADSTNLPRERSELLVMRAEFLIDEERQTEALAELRNAQSLAERSGHTKGLCMVRFIIGNLRYHQGRMEEAWTDYETALRMAAKGNHSRIVENCVNNLGAVAYQIDRLPLALQLFEGLLANMKPERGEMRAILLGKIAHFRALSGAGRSALPLFSKSLAISDSLGDTQSAGNTRRLLAATLWELGERREATRTMEEALEALIAAGDFKMQVDALQSLMEWHAALGEEGQALREARLIIHLNDSLQRAQYNERLALAEIGFETERKEHQIVEQQQELELARIEDRRKQLQRNLSITIAAALIVVALLLWRGLRARTKLASKERELHRRVVDQLMNESENKALHAMLNGQEKERNRIARELHDRVGSMLGALKMQMNALEARLENLHFDQPVHAAKVNHLLDETAQEVRRISHDMVSSNLSQLGLAEALKNLCDSLRVSGKPEVDLVLDGLDERLDRKVELEIYRIVQELISNALKHAKPEKLGITIARSPERISVSVADDGLGFDPSKARKGMGLDNVESRAASIGATVRWDSAPGKGTTAFVDCPLPTGLMRD